MNIMVPEKLKYAHEKDLLIEHLCSLSDEDRYLRFGFQINDEGISNYVSKSWDTFGNRWFGIFHEDKIVASLHCATIDHNNAEMGCTVAEEFRGKKYGQALFDRGLVWNRSNGAKHIYMHCLSQNKIIQHIAKKNDMEVVALDYSEKEAHLKFDNFDLTAPYKDLAYDRIAAVDAFYRNQFSIMKAFIGVKE